MRINIPFFNKKEFTPKTAPEKMGADWFYAIGAQGEYNDTKTALGQLYAYNYCQPVTSIVQKMTDSFLAGKICLEDKNGNEVDFKRYEKQLKLYINPNPLENTTQFLSKFYTFYKLFGEVFIYKVQPLGFKEYEYFILPNWLLTFYYKNGSVSKFATTSQLTKIQLNTGIETIDILKEDFIHFKNNIVNENESWRGQSLLYSCDSIVNNILTSIEARRSLMENKGPSVILTMDGGGVNSMPLLPAEKENIHKELKTKYGLKRSQRQIIITSASMRAQTMGFATKDLLLFEEKDDDVASICEAYNYPAMLLGLKNSSTYNNVIEARKSLYQDAIIPDSENLMKWINENCDLENVGLKIYFDHLEVFQKSEKEKAEALKGLIDSYYTLYQQGNITRNEYLGFVGLKAVEGGDTYITDSADDTPLAVKLGVGGTQSLQMIIADPNIKEEAKVNILIILFGLSDEQARLMV